jgi:RNA-directed DNA polymerase
MSTELILGPDELRAAFNSLETREDIAALLDIQDLRLRYYLYITDISSHYTVFSISKKSGGTREISAPITPLKIIQHKLNQVLQSVYKPKPSVHGFVQGKSIRTNARVHAHRKYVLNIDLKDFFPSINFGRVMGMFMGNPYFRNRDVAKVLAEICCFNKQLPQGAPTSPVVANMLCARLDAKLQQLAKKHRCTYTRYADDLTFSTSQAQFPITLARLNDDGTIEIGKDLLDTILDNHFEINSKKFRLQTRNHRQEVTGLTVNKFPNVTRKYVDQVRGMLHAWEKYGLESTQERYWQKYNHKHRNPELKQPEFKKVVRGKIEFIGMVRGKQNSIYLRLLHRYHTLAPDQNTKEDNREKVTFTKVKPLVITEGKTDWKHLKATLRNLKRNGNFSDLEIDFQENETSFTKGDSWIIKHCQSLSLIKQPVPTICIVDRDKPNIVKQVSEEGNSFKKWGNNVYSFPIPIPSHRVSTPEISIEFYYFDNDIIRKDSEGRRLFVSDEFNSRSGRHTNEDLVCNDRNKLQGKTKKIVDNDVFDRNDVNIALSKNDFADNILNEVEEFTAMDMSEFSKIFTIINEIIDDFNSN